MDLVNQLGLSTPIMQAPMAGASNAQFVAAACQVGALGSLGAGMMSAHMIKEQVATIKSLTRRPFAVNLMVLPEELTDSYSQNMPSWLEHYYQDLGISYVLDDQPAPNFSQQFQALIDSKVPVASFTFGILDQEQVAALHHCQSLVIGTANHVDEVLAWARVGADAVVVQGSEAGGHQGGWLYQESPPIDLIKLLKDSLAGLADHNLKLPLIASGGIASLERVSDCLACGAQMVSVGTAFLTTHQSIIHPVWRQAILQARQGQSSFTRLFSGRLAKGLKNQFMQDFAYLDGLVRHEDLPIYPSLNAMTKPLRAWATKSSDAQKMSLWAGDGAHLCRNESVQELVDRLTPKAYKDCFDLC